MPPPSRAKVESRNCLWTNQSYIQTATISYALLVKLCIYDTSLVLQFIGGIARMEVTSPTSLGRLFLFQMYQAELETRIDGKKYSSSYSHQWCLKIALNRLTKLVRCRDVDLPDWPCASYPAVWQMAHIKKLKKQTWRIYFPAGHQIGCHVIRGVHMDASLDIW